MNLFKKQKQVHTDTENKLMITKVEVGINQVYGINRYIQYTKQINNDLQYRTRNYIQYLIILIMEKTQKRKI